MDTRTYAVSKDDFMHCVVHNTDDTLILPNSIALSYDEYYITPDNYASNYQYDYAKIGITNITQDIIVSKQGGRYSDIRLNTVGGY